MQNNNETEAINYIPYDGYIACLHRDSVLSNEQRKVFENGCSKSILDGIGKFDIDLFLGKLPNTSHINNNIK